MKQGFMPHSDRFPNISRDWEDVDCRTIICINNICGKCVIPSLAKINDQGKCTGFHIKTTKDSSENKVN